MKTAQSQKIDSHSARVIMWDGPVGDAQDQKILHAVRVEAAKPGDAAKYVRGIRETVQFDAAPVMVPVASIRETLPYSA